MTGRLEGRRVLVTHADTAPGATDDAVARAGEIDVLVANFAGPREAMPVTNMLVDATEWTDESFQAYLDHLVWPFLRVVRAALPGMYAHGGGRVVGATSATPLQAIPGGWTT